MKSNKTITNKLLGSQKHPNMFADEMSMNSLDQILRPGIKSYIEESVSRDLAPTEKKLVLLKWTLGF